MLYLLSEASKSIIAVGVIALCYVIVMFYLGMTGGDR